jgi:hypothetical protein
LSLTGRSSVGLGRVFQQGPGSVDQTLSFE